MFEVDLLAVRSTNFRKMLSFYVPRYEMLYFYFISHLLILSRHPNSNELLKETIQSYSLQIFIILTINLANCKFQNVFSKMQSNWTLLLKRSLKSFSFQKGYMQYENAYLEQNAFQYKNRQGFQKFFVRENAGYNSIFSSFLKRKNVS